MQRFNKVVALLLCVVMLIGFMPVSALAADGAGTVVDAAIIFSDLHTSSGDYKESTLKGILNGIKNAGVTPSSVTSAGDAFSVNEDSTKYTGYTSTLTGYIQSVFAGVPVNYVWSDHDRYAVEADGSTLLDKTSRLVYGAGADGVYGTDDDGNYYIYSLSMGDLCSYDRYSAGFNYTQSSNNRASKGFTSTVAEAIENFKADAAKLNKDRPLFITSHQPLFDNRNDNAFAEDWFDAINEVAEGMDVAFFYGHNHKYDTGSDYYYAKGSKMNVATADNWNWNYEVGQGWKPSVDLTSEQKTLNFTHMCAGYMDPSSTGSTSSTTREGVAMAITIYDDAINYTTYNSSGVYTGNYALNETVEREHAVTVEIVEKTDTATGITVAAPGITGLTVTEIQDPVYDSQVYNAYASYDITVGDYVQGTTAAVTIPTPAGFDKTKSAVVLDQGSKIATDTDLSDGITFTTNHFSTYDIAQRALSNAVTAEGTLSSGIEVVGDPVNSVTSGTYYYLVNTRANKTLTGTANGNRLSMSGTQALTNVNRWYITRLSNGTYHVQYQGPEGKYLTLDNDSASLTDTPTALTLNYVANNVNSWEIKLGSYYLNNYRGEHNYASGYTNGAAGDTGSRWHFYPVTTVSTYYELDTDGLDYGSDNKYLIVGSNNAVALKPNGSNTTTQNVTIQNNIITNGSADLEWYFLKNTNQTGSTTYDTLITQNGNTWLYHTNSNMYINNNQDAHRGYWQLYGSNNGNYTFRDRDGNNDWYLYYNGSNFTVRNNNTSTYVRLFKKVVASSGETVTLSVAPGTATVNPGSSLDLTHEVTLDGEVLTDGYEIIWSSENTDIVTVNGNGKVTAVGIGNATITATLTSVNDSAPSSTVRVSIQINVPEVAVERIEVAPMVGSVERGAGADTPTGSIMTVTYDDGTTEEIPVTVGMITGDSLNLKANGTYGNLTVTYGGKTVEGYALNVVNVSGNNYPEYPNEGAVKVGKTGTGIDFQSSGIAQVEISASGIPIKKGADIIVMVDTSSSMQRHVDCGEKSCNDSSCSKVTRQEELVKALNALVEVFQTKDESGGYRDLKVAFADFNGFFGDQGNTTFEGQTVSGTTPYDLDSEDYTDAHFNADGSVHVIQGSSLDYSAFMTPAQMTGIDFGEFETKSGTNYDYAFDVIYQLGHAAKKHNEQIGENRDLFVIFMSDGAPNQFNYFGAVGGNNGSSKLWDNWLLGSWTADDLNSANLNSTTNKHYYDLNDHDNDGFINEHRMASAIKGSPDDMFEVIRKSTAGLTDILTETHTNNLYEVPGLGATMYSIAFAPANDGDIDKESMLHALQQIASDQEGTTKYYYEVEASAGLADIFKGIGSEIAYAAYNARFVDQMGDDYNLQMKTSTYSVVDGTSTTRKTLAPKIEIISYDIYTAGETIPVGKHIGDRKGTYKVLETVTFNADGTEAYSDQINGGQTNILADGTQAGYVKGVIYAKTFLYNTNATGVAIDGVSIPTGRKADGTTTGSSNVLPAETFYWKMGTVQTSELAMRYYVYLTGSMEGTRAGGSYPTNEYATLYYDNYLGNPCQKDTVSPVMPWKEANVSYAFYLVNDAGQIIVNQTTGQTGSFANKIAVTNPVVYETVLLNSDEEVSSIDIASLGVLPEGYTLFDYDGNETGATYTVNINSNTTGSWEITTVKDVATTYVTQYDPDDASAYSNDRNNSTIGDDYTHTVVWFAVLWKVQALPDTVVIDYGLPVDISVLANDMFGENGKLAGVGACSDSLNLDGHDAAMASGFGTSYTGTYGTAKADASTGKVRYTPANMQMNGYEKFAYAVNYTGNENAGCYYDTVTVIPATTIYYEDSFVTYESQTWNNGWQDVENTADEKYVWEPEGTAVDGVQAEDRPGQYALTDANNIYGYDSVNLGMSTYSMGSAMKATVDYDNRGIASFTFWGTGFDVISMTSNATGSIYLEVLDQDGNMVVDRMVDTYYGYTRVLYNVTYKYEQVNAGTEAEPEYTYQWIRYKGEPAAEGTEEQKAVKPEEPQPGDEVTGVEYVWVENNDARNSIYQVPVIQANDLDYGKYTARIIASYDEHYDHVAPSNATGSYDFYLDAIRIYDPADDGAADGTTDTTIEDAYKADHEGWPSYIELRDNLIAAAEIFDSTTGEITGMVFIDGDPEVGSAQLSDYVSYGPNNEVYLAPDQRVAFRLAVPGNIDRIHMGIKSADGQNVTYSIRNIAADGKDYGEMVDQIDTASDMYYDITGYKNDIVVIENTGDSGILSITNIKSTYTSDPNAAANGGVVPQSLADERFETYIYMTAEDANLTVKALKPAPVNPFADIDIWQFFYECVLWAVENGITNGISDSYFGPYLNCNRAQVVTFLWRANGSPAPASRVNPFVDVPEDSWYTDAVLWAVEKGITNGLTADTFGPDVLCNRAQVVTFLWRANGSMASGGAANPFADVSAGTFYHDAVSWAVRSGITTGASVSEFDPNGICMRAHVVTFLYRAEQLPELAGSGWTSES